MGLLLVYREASRLLTDSTFRMKEITRVSLSDQIRLQRKSARESVDKKETHMAAASTDVGWDPRSNQIRRRGSQGTKYARRV